MNCFDMLLKYLTIKERAEKTCDRLFWTEKNNRLNLFCYFHIKVLYFFFGKRGEK